MSSSKVTEKKLKDALEYIGTLQTKLPKYDGLASLLYYKPSDLKRLGLTIEDVKEMLNEKD